MGSFHFARRYFGNHVCFLFLRLLRCFSSPGSLRMTIGIAPFHHTVTEVCSAGFPHSEIHGSGLICSSPWLFAAYHVFLRLLVPRHPPCALLRLTLQLSLVRILSSLIHRSVVYKVFLNFLLPFGSSLNVLRLRGNFRYLSWIFRCLVNNKWLIYYLSLSV